MCSSKNSWQNHNSRNIRWMYLCSTIIAHKSCCVSVAIAAGKDTVRQIDFAEIRLAQLSVGKKNRTKRTSSKSCHFENGAKKFIKPDLGSDGQQKNGAGIERSGKHKSSRMKIGVFLGPARVLLQARENNRWKRSNEQFRVHHWESFSCSECNTALAFAFRVREKIVQHRKHRSHELPRPCLTFATHSTIRDLTIQTDIPHDASEAEITDWEPRSTRNPNNGSTFWPQQHDARPRIGPDMVPPNQPARADDETSIQETETSRSPMPHPWTNGSTWRSWWLGRTWKLITDNAHSSYHVQTPSKSIGPLWTSREKYQIERWLRFRASLCLSTSIGHSVWQFERWHGCVQWNKNAWHAWLAWLAITPNHNQFSLDEETKQQICSNPDPETAFNVMVKRGRAETNVSTLSAQHKRELGKAKDKELNTFAKYSAAMAASRQRLSPSALLKKKKTRSAVTLKDDGQIESTVGDAKCNWRKASRNANIKSNRIPSVTSDGPDTYCFTCFSYS